MSIMKSLDRWRSYFRSCSSSSDIFEIIDHAIMVATSDFFKEFRLRRDCIVEMLFSCKQTRCVDCDRVELSVPAGTSKGSKVNSSRDDIDDHGDMDVNRVLSNYNFDEVEALTDEMEDQ
ncbi:hypothetical protein HN51_027006 [Arachis hypogaea]